MKDNLIEVLKKALSTKIEELSFDNNSYLNDGFIERSINTNFAGWFSETDISIHTEFILHKCQIPAKSKILDAACGHGRHTNLLSQCGHDVVGTDISSRLISYLRNKYGPEAKFEKKRFRDIDYSATFDLAIVLGNSLSLVPRYEITDALSRLCNSLKIGGKLFIELDNRSWFLRNEAGKHFWNYYKNRWLTLSEHYYDGKDKLEKTLDIGIDILTEEIDLFCLTKCLFNHEEFSGFLKKTGLKEFRSYGDWNGSPVRDDSPSLLIIAQREF